MGVRGRAAALISPLLLVVACGGGSSPTTTPAVSAARPTAATATPVATATAGTPASAPATPTESGPATATLNFTGDPHLAAGLTQPVVQCNFPNEAGPVITVVTAAVDKADAAFLSISADRVRIRLSSGQGTAITARDFEGEGVDNFDAAKGATLNAHLTDTTKAGVATGNIPVLQAISGTISCGGQTAGSGTMHVTATLPEGKIDQDLGMLRVVCNSDTTGATTVAVAGLADLAGAKLVLGATILSSGVVTLYVPTLPSGHILTATTPGSGTISGLGGTFNADATGETPAVTAHLSGTVTCGSAG